MTDILMKPPRFYYAQQVFFGRRRVCKKLQERD
jgi:hypothetical protein